MRRAVDDVQYETVPGSHNKVSLIKYRKPHPSTQSKKDLVLNPYDRARSQALSLTMLLELGDHLRRQSSPEELMKIFLYTVMGRLTTHPVVLFGPIALSAPFGIVGQVGLSRKISIPELALPRHGWVIETLWAHRGPFLVDEFRRLKIPAEELESLDRIRAALLIPLFLFERLRGVLALGPKRSGRAFSEDDVNLVTFLGNFVLLLHHDLEKVERQSIGVPARMAGDLRAAVRGSIARLSQSSREAGIEMILEGDKGVPPVSIGGESLKDIVMTLMLHILYLTKEGEKIRLSLKAADQKGSLAIAYSGTPLGFEKGRPGYNHLIDQMIAGTVRLREARRLLEEVGGAIEVKASGDETQVMLQIPLQT
jgi:hypothetical protein